ncbi:hypothetical protein KIPB_016482, partial [Kipferlia bialata]
TILYTYFITTDRYDYVDGTMAEHKKPWAQEGLKNEDNKDLMTVIRHVKPTGLLGLSTIPGAFTIHHLSLSL